MLRRPLRFCGCLVFAALLVPLGVGCTDNSPKAAAERAVRGVYAEALGNREGERNVMRRLGTERMQATLAASESSCADILANEAPNHGLVGSAATEFERACISGLPLSCGSSAAKLTAVSVDDNAGELASVHATVDVDGKPQSVELTLKLVANKYLLDEVRCP